VGIRSYLLGDVPVFADQHSIRNNAATTTAAIRVREDVADDHNVDVNDDDAEGRGGEEEEEEEVDRR